MTEWAATPRSPVHNSPSPGTNTSEDGHLINSSIEKGQETHLHPTKRSMKRDESPNWQVLAGLSCLDAANPLNVPDVHRRTDRLR
mgnify:CR=1 FL=1